MPRSHEPRRGRATIAPLNSIVLGVVAACFLAGCHSRARPAASTPAPPATPTAAFAAVVASADRIEVGAYRPEGQPVAPDFVVSGPGVAAQFISEVPFDDLGGPFRCACVGTAAIRFLHGDTVLATLTVHHGRSVRWIDGPWPSDVFFEGVPTAALVQWQHRHGKASASLITLPQPPKPQTFGPVDDFAAHFPAEARHLVPPGSMSTQGWDARRIASDLASYFPDTPSLLHASFLALGRCPIAWEEDDMKIGCVQNAILECPDEAIVAALEAHATDDEALAGAARVFFRFTLARRFHPAVNAVWIPRLADVVLRTGQPRNQSLLLVHLAEARDPAANAFLRELATGARTYAWEMPCWYSGDTTPEPSLVASASVLLALSGDPDAPRLAKSSASPVHGLDEAAAEIAAVLLDPSRPVKPAHLKYPSHILGYAASEALARQDPGMITLPTVQRAFQHPDHWVARRVNRIVEASSLTRDYGPDASDLFSAAVDQMLVSDHPALAVERCTEELAARTGTDRTALLVLRGIARESIGDAAGAIADFKEAMTTGGYPQDALHRRLAWLHWREGRIEDATRHVEAALQETPNAEMLVLRGFARFADDDFGPLAEMDFSAALALNPQDHYARVLHHLCVSLAGHPERSHLRTEFPPPASDGALRIVVQLGPISSAPQATAGWPMIVAAYFRGDIDETRFLASAEIGRAEARPVQSAEAHFYIAQQARVRGDVEAERTHLGQCVAAPIPTLVEYQVALRRLQRLP